MHRLVLHYISIVRFYAALLMFGLFTIELLNVVLFQYCTINAALNIVLFDIKLLVIASFNVALFNVHHLRMHFYILHCLMLH